MSEFRILEQLQGTSGKNDKVALLKSSIGNTNLCELFDAVFNYKRKFFMKKWRQLCAPRPPYTSASHEEFIGLLNKLEGREVTGNAAISLVEDFFRRCDREQQDWYSRILRQDLKIGVNIDTLIKSGYNIPIFEVQLASDGKKCKRVQDLLKKGLYASRKYDGYRCIAVIEDGECTLMSRNGSVYENFPSIKKELEELLPIGHYVFDGEIMSDDFNAMQRTAFAAKRGTAVGDVKYHIFDYIPHSEWISDKFVSVYTERREKLKDIFNNQFSNCTNLVLVESTKVNSLEEIYNLEAKYIEDGFEGVICNPDIPYYRGRPANSMLKFKTFKSMDCPIVECLVGTGRNSARLGKVLVRQENGNLCEVGSGFTDEERDWIWENSNNVIGSIIEVKYQELTPDGIMRFPVKMRYRGDIINGKA